MRVSEKGILASLALLLLAVSAIAQTRILIGTGEASLSWQAEIGFYLPFVLFALVSTYHFLEWARKHKRQAVLMMILTIAVLSLIGNASVNAPRPILNTPTREDFSSTQRPASTIQIQPQPVSIQESLLKLREALSQTPYFSTGFDALMLGASAIALALVILKIRRERKSETIRSFAEPATAEFPARTPREAVIEAYRLALVSLQAHDIGIRDSDTPEDAFRRIKQLRPMIADAFWKLTILFEEAKFSLHPISESEAEYASSYCKSILSLEAVQL